MAPRKPKTEYRVICGNFGSRGHSSHAWPKANKAKAKQAVIDLDHHAEIHPTSYYAGEAPYEIQTREVTALGKEAK